MRGSRKPRLVPGSPSLSLRRAPRVEAFPRVFPPGWPDLAGLFPGTGEDQAVHGDRLHRPETPTRAMTTHEERLERRSVVRRRVQCVQESKNQD